MSNLSRGLAALVLATAPCGLAVSAEPESAGRLVVPVKDVAVPGRVAVQVAQNAGGAAGAAVMVRSGASAGTAHQERRDVDPNDDRERFLVLLPGGPIVVEARISLDGKPFRTAREKLVDEVLAQADTDGDGKPTWTEALANPRFGFGRFQYLLRNDQQKEALLKRCDADADGLVDRYEARIVIAEMGSGATFQVTANPYAFQQPDVKAILDTDKDGVISGEELAGAGERLKSRDANDNDLLEPGELGGTAEPGLYQLVAGRATPARPAAAFLLGPAADLAAIDRELRRRYAAADKQELRSENFPLLPKLVEQLDLNRNGLLEPGEAVGFQLLEPQLTLNIRLADDAGGQTEIVVASLAAELGGLERVREKGGRQLALDLPGVTLKLNAFGAASQTASYDRYAEQTLSRLDTDKNGYLEKKELEQDASGRPFLQAFDLWDADRDGKVYKQDITAAYLRQNQPLLSQVSLLAAEQGPSFFAALDSSGDNRLSVREMRTARDRLLSFDKDGDGRLSLEEMSGEITLNFARGGATLGAYGISAVQFRPGGQNQPARTPPGPKWFVHMDRNGDGDVTLREFLGTPEQFQRLDANGDGFIELKEAEAASPGDDRPAVAGQRSAQD